MAAGGVGDLRLCRQVELRNFGTKNLAPDAAPARIWGSPRCWLKLGLKYCVTCEAYALGHCGYTSRRQWQFNSLTGMIGA